uniref:Uncharacterized protein n=1 Tax=Nymphaea colorata TaxID=210225 RepID=A0A5K1ED22_9MAGN
MQCTRCEWPQALAARHVESPNLFVFHSLDSSSLVGCDMCLMYR